MCRINSYFKDNHGCGFRESKYVILVFSRKMSRVLSGLNHDMFRQEELFHRIRRNSPLVVGSGADSTEIGSRYRVPKGPVYR